MRFSRPASNDSLPDQNCPTDSILSKPSSGLSSYRIIKPLTMVTGKIMNYIICQGYAGKQFITNNKNTVPQ